MHALSYHFDQSNLGQSLHAYHLEFLWHEDHGIQLRVMNNMSPLQIHIQYQFVPYVHLRILLLHILKQLRNYSDSLIPSQFDSSHLSYKKVSLEFHVYFPLW